MTTVPSAELRLRMRTVGGTATAYPGYPGNAHATPPDPPVYPDYWAADRTVVIPPDFSTWEVDLVRLIPDELADNNETVFVELSDASVISGPWGFEQKPLEIERRGVSGSAVLETGESVRLKATIKAPRIIDQHGRYPDVECADHGGG